MINSGDIVVIAEVVRDPDCSESQPEQPLSERQLDEAVLSIDCLVKPAWFEHRPRPEPSKKSKASSPRSPRRGAKSESGLKADGETDQANAGADGYDTAVADEAA